MRRTDRLWRVSVSDGDRRRMQTLRLNAVNRTTRTYMAQLVRTITKVIVNIPLSVREQHLFYIGSLRNVQDSSGISGVAKVQSRFWQI